LLVLASAKEAASQLKSRCSNPLFSCREREAHIERELRQLHSILSTQPEEGQDSAAGQVPQQGKVVANAATHSPVCKPTDTLRFVSESPAQNRSLLEGLESVVASLRAQVQGVREELLARAAEVQSKQRENVLLHGVIREMKVRWETRERDFAKTRKEGRKELKAELSATVRRLEDTRAQLADRDKVIEEIEQKLLEHIRIAPTSSKVPRFPPICFSRLAVEQGGQEEAVQAKVVAVTTEEFQALGTFMEVSVRMFLTILDVSKNGPHSIALPDSLQSILCLPFDK
jgi:Skp family chaperone for outer membrane proteins